MLGKDLLKCDMGNEKYLMVKDIENNVYLTLVSYDMELPSYLRGCRLTASHFVMLVMNELVIDEHLRKRKKEMNTFGTHIILGTASHAAYRLSYKL